MRILSPQMILGLAATVALASHSLPASADSFYQWETENGGIAFTDDTKRIPARYREAAAPIATRTLGDFGRFTPMAPSQPVPYAARLDDRLSYLRELNQRTISPDAVQAPSAGYPGMVVGSRGTGHGVQTFVDPSRSASQEPIIVETVRSRAAGSPVTRHITVVRQGDRVLSVTKPKQLHSRLRWVDERSLED